jgi:hypothetical protein
LVKQATSAGLAQFILELLEGRDADLKEIPDGGTAKVGLN